LSVTKVKNRISKIYYQFPFEAFIWITGLLILAFLHPEDDQHFSLCLFKALGFKYCPGCGLGRSVAFLIQGNFVRSLQAHPLGPFALGILICRIYQLMKNFIREEFLNKPYHGKRIETIT
jgi:hypothetical protein